MTVDYTAQQLLVLWSAVSGVLLSIYYDAFRLLRALGIRSRFFVFLQDVTFCITAALVYILLIFNLSNGVIRFYAFVIIAAAFLLWHFTIGALFMKCVNSIKTALITVYRKISRALHSFAEKLSKRRHERIAKKKGIADDKKNRRQRHG